MARGADTRAAQLIRIPPAPMPPPAAAEAPQIAPAPGALLPTAIRVLQDSPGAGLAMYGTLMGTARSAAGVVLAVFAYSGAFDPTPSPLLLLADATDRHAQALFAAAGQGVPLIGVAAVSLDDSGGDVTVVYDRAEVFATSFGPLQQGLAQIAAVEIGMTDNSASETETEGAYVADAAWQPLVATNHDDLQADSPLVRTLLDALSRETMEQWRIILPTGSR